MVQAHDAMPGHREIAFSQFFNGAFDFADDLFDGIGRKNDALDLANGALGKIHERGQKTLGFEINADEGAAAGVEGEQRGRAAAFAFRLLPFDKKTFGDEAINISADGGGREAELAGEFDAGQILPGANAAEQLGFKVGDDLVLVPGWPTAGLDATRFDLLVGRMIACSIFKTGLRQNYFISKITCQ